MSSDALNELKLQLQQFAEERDWDQFHSPKNFASALIVEAAELLEHFQWLTQEQSRNLNAETKQEVALEMADVFIYLIRLADKLDIDLVASARTKIELNEKKYPVEKSRGIATKYNRL